MSFTNEQLKTYLGGQIRIVSSVTDEIQCGSIRSISLREGILKIRYNWFARNDGSAKAPIDEWTMVRYVRGRDFNLSHFLSSVEESECLVMHSARTQERVRIYPKEYNGSEKLDETNIKTKANLLDREYILLVLEGMMRRKKDITAFSKKYRISFLEIQMILAQLISRLVTNEWRNPDTVNVINSTCEIYNFTESFIIDVMYEVLKFMVFIQNNEAAEIVTFIVKNFLMGPGKPIPVELPELPKIRVIDEQALKDAQREREQEIEDIICSEDRVDERVLDQEEDAPSFSRLHNDLLNLILSQTSVSEILQRKPELGTGLMELLSDANTVLS